MGSAKTPPRRAKFVGAYSAGGIRVGVGAVCGAKTRIGDRMKRYRRGVPFFWAVVAEVDSEREGGAAPSNFGSYGRE